MFQDQPSTGRLIFKEKNLNVSYFSLMVESGPLGCLQSAPSIGTHQGAAATFEEIYIDIISTKLYEMVTPCFNAP